MKALVVYYSLTGNTRLAAGAIAEVLDAAVVEITEIRPRKPRFLGYLTGGLAALRNKGSEIRPVDVDVKQYERVFIGSPVWASRPTPAINSFIYKTDFEGQSVVAFFTMGGDSAEQAVTNIAAKIGKSQGKVAGSFAITSNGVSDEEMMARAREAVRDYSG